ncbi:enoyl-CoA hydratase/isomerase family protein [Microbacterium sp. NC79]|uniref:enoyl-CoA hydratase/isomerase family protein n=1 Tax=Microbacterium sp. NC79 TaxID=2851009 RepID=UPI001C2CC489|nr:enoyl-CoA hydratase/isomerase family protein [Microbacterium sp. NC79]MBV0896146.1 enoyl-CoA hydratase/isomerase family protein [Microbacterium sp. NC79]
MTDANDAIHLAIRDGVATVTLNRPDRRNALDADAWRDLRETVTSIRVNPDVRVTVIQGAGDHFCAGADIRAGGPRRHPLDRMRNVSDAVLAIYDLPMPTVAVVRGSAVGAGWNVALACDFVLAAEDAQFNQIFARRGLSVDCGGSWLLPRIVGPQQAKRLIYMAEMIGAAEAADLGLVLSTHAPEALEEAAMSLVDRLRAAPPAAVDMDKQLINSTWTTSFADQLLRENIAQGINFATDAPAARAAIAEGKKPEFEGKWQL